ncbi:uncharacterized protein TNCT_579011 [Trichonephila clavata]|uniref:Uncharacterized protein n=1 Tax=Trichonephila clavata TaxID=2740835 RepID=A0A8X6IAB9_TRICU|nr:uncharacterized protein TNCT_579011 [Trichonephila clavata]
MRDISLNAQYIILFKNNRDVGQIQYFARQVYGNKASSFMDAYKKSTQEEQLLFLKNSYHPIFRKHLTLEHKDIENQISRLLHESNYSDDTKAKLLSQLLLKYQHIINEPKPPLRVTIEESKEQGQELPRSNTLEDSILRKLILSAPTNFQKFIQPIVEKLKTRNYAWNEYGELMKDSEIIKGTNVIDLFSYLMRNVKKGYEPYGFAVFGRHKRDKNPYTMDWQPKVSARS